MEKTVDFKQVAYQARFNIMSAVQLPPPEVFKRLSDDEKYDLYKRIFETYHDLTNFLTSSLDIDDLQTRYWKD